MEQLPIKSTEHHLMRVREALAKDDRNSAQYYILGVGQDFERWKKRGVHHDEGPMQTLFDAYQQLTRETLN